MQAEVHYTQVYMFVSIVWVQNANFIVTSTVIGPLAVFFLIIYIYIVKKRSACI